MIRRFASFALLAGLLATGRADALGLLPDPSTHKPFACTPSQSLTYTDAQFGAIQGRIYWPVPSLCSPAVPPPAKTPVVLFFTGAGYNFTEYSVLAQHLAGNGFATVVVQAEEPNPPIHCNPLAVACIEDRAREGVAYLKLLRDNWAFAGQLDFTTLALAGHSRGGEAAVEAAAVIRAEEPTLGSARAVIALAPSDIGTDGVSGRRRLLARQSSSFLVLYGSRDEQVSGYAAGFSPPPVFLPHQTPFALYDRAGTEASIEGLPISSNNLIQKTMQFLYGGNHDQFSDRCGSPLACGPSVIACASQRTFTKGMVNAYLRWKIHGESAYKTYFDGSTLAPWGLDIWPQYSDGQWNSRRVIDNFQDAEIPTNTLGGALTVHGSLTAQVVDNWHDLRVLHGDEDGQRLEVINGVADPSNILQWTIPAGSGDVTSFKQLSFRVGLAYGSLGPANVSVRLQRGNAWSSVVSTAPEGEIPAPDAMGHTVNLSGLCYPERAIIHMRTLRIPLTAFGGDLTNVQKVQIRFDDPSADGKTFYIDNLEFTGL